MERLNWSDPRVRAIITKIRRDLMKRHGRKWTHKHDLKAVERLFQAGLINSDEYEQHRATTLDAIHEIRAKKQLHPNQTALRVY
jgi:predicted glycosyltransferase